MNIQQVIKNRRSVFPVSYTGGTISENDINQILDAARWAPTHKKTEPWRYKVLSGAALKRLGAFLSHEFERSTGKQSSLKVRKLEEKLMKSSHVFLIFMNRDKKERIPEWEEIAAVSMSVQNMWLTASYLGYGAYWSSPKPFAKMSLMEDLNVQQNEKFLGFLYLGTIDKNVEDLPERKPLNDVVQFIK